MNYRTDYPPFYLQEEGQNWPLLTWVGLSVNQAEADGKDPVEHVAGLFIDPAIGEPDLEAAAWWVAAFREAVASG